jgi:ATP/maltotriose-dependent transcriptional regulator MalT
MLPTAPHRARLLRPRLAGDVVERPRLVAPLAAGLARPLTLVCAPAGYGKTTLLCQWLAAVPARVAWLSLDASDSDLADFVAAAIGALQALWPAAGRQTLGLLRLPVTPSPDYLGATLADELLDLPEPTILALDDYHTIADPAVHAFVAALLEYPPPAFHLALATRVEPPLPLPRLRARDQVTELRAREMAFTPDEAATFLTRASGMGVSPAEAAQLGRQTEGWAAGLRLAALALREEGGSALLERGFAGRRQRHALDFLLAEVLARLPAALEDFLLRTSVAERVCGPLGEALLDPPPPAGQGAATLRRLVGTDLFIVALGEDGEDREWFRYHSLFRELLRERLLERAGPAVAADLYRRAGRWLAAHGLVDEALATLLAGGEEDEAARVVEERVTAVLDRNEVPTLWRWLRMLPEALVRRRPGLLLAYAWVENMRARPAALAERLRAATALLDGAADAETAGPALRAQVYVLTALASMFRDDGAAAEAPARAALPLAPDRQSYLGGTARSLVGGCLYRRGRDDEALRFLGAGGDDAAGPRELLTLTQVTFHHVGDIPDARRWAARLLAIAERRDLPIMRGWAHYYLGRLAYEHNVLEEARAQFAAVVAGYRANFACHGESLLGLALTDQALGQAARSERSLAALDELLAETGNDEGRPHVNAGQARLALQRGDRAEVLRWLATAPPAWADHLPYLECPSVTAARALLARGEPGDAAAALARLAVFRARAERERMLNCVVQARAVEALAERARGDGAAALDHLAAALALAEPGGFVRTFLDLGPPLADLLRALAARRPPSPYLARLLRAFDATRAAASAPERAVSRPSATDPALALFGQLTEREVQVLEQLARHLTNKEIAEVLSISPQTVKRHVSNLYDKLGVGSRRQAIVQATALGLLPPATR